MKKNKYDPNKTDTHMHQEKVLLDLVCGMKSEEKSSFKFIYKGKEYHFCSTRCKEHFENDPEMYLGI